MAETGLHLIYFADPMCSWCWGFAPVIAAVQERYRGLLPIRVIMGGLRPGTDKPMTDEARAEILTHWGHVNEASGQAFVHTLLEKPGFIYDTDPGARAVVLVRRTEPSLALTFLERAQRAFYAEGRDITQDEVLADLAAELGFDRGLFLTGLSEEALKQETWRDYAISQRAGVRGFPTLLVGPQADGAFAMVTHGYQDAAPVMHGIDGWLAQVRAA